MQSSADLQKAHDWLWAWETSDPIHGDIPVEVENEFRGRTGFWAVLDTLCWVIQCDDHEPTESRAGVQAPFEEVLFHLGWPSAEPYPHLLRHPERS